ncbi:hypothetical protein Ancab_029408 [Ancistrocladus abbreviatus]
MLMERGKWNRKLLQLLFLSLLHSAPSSDFPSQGCYWTETCMHKWWGDCGGLVYNQSDNCYGLCQGPKYSPCPTFHTRFFCCVAGSPKKVVDGCQKCDHKVDYGDEFVCCSDCSYPDMVYSDSSSGYCKTGAELILQPKPKEVFKWVTGPWLPCSSSCGGGIRSRTVECFAVIEDTSTPDYPVYDDHCSNEERPSKQELCNLESCAEDKNNRSDDRQHGRMPAWLVTILILLGVVAVGAVGFAGYLFYTRRTSNQHGYVYIMLEGYS